MKRLKFFCFIFICFTVGVRSNHVYSNSGKQACPEKIKIKPSSLSPDFYFFKKKLTVEDGLGHEVMSVNKTFIEEDYESDNADLEHRILENIECDKSDLSIFKDVNFDGYNDIKLSMATGILINQVGWVWLYNPANNIFEFSKEYDDKIFFNVEINPQKKYLMTYSTSAGNISQSLNIYTWDNEGIKELKFCEFKADEKAITPQGEMKKASVNNLQECLDMFGQQTEQDRFIKMLPKEK